MKRLFVKTKTGNIPIDPAVARKYGLKAGAESPFSGGRIVGENGETTPEKAQAKPSLEGTQGELVNDEIAEIDNAVTLSQSEIIDFSHGVDSNPNG